jgi:hypothetical protein
MKKFLYVPMILIFATATLGGEETVSACGKNQKIKQGICKQICDTNLAFEQAIRDRIETGFDNWNMGYEAWLEWCDILYEPDAYYNVYGQRLTLQQYKDMMGQLFAAYDIELGELDNILVEGDWVSIRYTVYITDKLTGVESELHTMEFVHFKNNPEPIGARVIEGWAISDRQLSPGQ